MRDSITHIWRWLVREAKADRWILLRRALGGAFNVLVVAVVGRALLELLDPLLGITGDDTVIETIKRWFPRIGLGGLLLYYMIDVGFFLVFSLQEGWRSVSERRQDDERSE